MNIILFWIKITVSLLILTQLSLFSQTDYPEWERLDYEGFTPSEIMKIEVNSKNELIGLLPTGVFRSTDLGNNWKKLNTPDSLVYDLHRALIVNKNIIIAYAYKNNNLNNVVYFEAMNYIVISFNYGVNWEVIDANAIFPKTLLTCSDIQGNFWGRGGRYIKDSNNKEIYLSSVVKFDFDKMQFNRVFERNFDRLFIISPDSILIAYSIFDTVFNEHTPQKKNLSILYVFVSEDSGETWNTINPDGGDIPYYIFEKFQIMLYNPFFYKGSLYFIKNNSSDENDNSYFAIDINNKKYSYEKLHDFYLRGDFTKYKDSLILFAGGIKSRDGWSIWRTNDDMKTWEKINFNTHISYPYLTIDSNANIFAKEDEGIWRLNKDSCEWTLQNNGLQSLSGAYLTVNSKSEIVAYFFNNDKFKIYNPVKNKWIDPGIDSCRLYEEPFSFRGFMMNDDFILYTYCGLKSWNQNTGSMDDILIEDSLKLFDIIYKNNSMVYGNIKYLKNNQDIQFINTFSEDAGKTWQINHNYNNPGYKDNYLSLFNKNKDWIVFADSGQIYLSQNRGTDWMKVLNDTANPKLYDSWSDESIDSPDYCLINTYSGVGYVVYGSDRGSGSIIYLTTDNGYTWSDITDNDSITKMIKLQHDRWSFYTQRNNLLPDHSNGYFYACTPCGIYRSTDSLKSFHCISEDKIEPSEIKDVVLGNDGRLYAVNIRGIWRTKTKVINSAEDNNYINTKVGIIVYPNPASDYITIKIKTLEGSVAELYDILGVKVITEPIHPMTSSHRMNIENLPAGVYFVKIGDRVEKFVKL